MPIYEYRCAGCKRRVSIFFQSFASAEQRVAAGEVECPSCGGKELSRMVSRVNMVRGGSAFDSENFGDFEDGNDAAGMFDGMDGEDPRAIARWARQMKEQLGGDADLGPEFDRALARIESGEDPDKVMEDLDPEAMGEMGGGDQALNDLDGAMDDLGDFGSTSVGEELP
jgi:putative FmdB family regulatory protein